MDRVIKAARSSGSLNLSNRSLREVPDEVYKSTSAVGDDAKWWEAVELQKLILAHNNIELLKDELRNLPLLTVLNVSHNKLSELPAAIGELTMLKSLDVSFNSILQLPEEIGSATFLVNHVAVKIWHSMSHRLVHNLVVSNNVIISLPEDLANCSKLMKLDMEGNKLTILSEKLIGSWTKLTELNASKNLLGGISENIGNLSRLIRLDLHQNKISSIPVSIMGCSSLAEIYMGNNALSTLPAEMSTLSHLGTLDLQSNQAVWNSATITDNNNLNPLDMLTDELKEYPVEACKLRLSLLNLSNNSLSGLPPELEVWESTELIKVDLSRNSIQELPVELSSCINLQIPPGGFQAAPMLQILDLSGNVASLPEHPAFSSLPHLQELYLRQMQLREVPSEVLSLQQLRILDLSQNSLQLVPVGLLEPSLQALRLDGNPLRRIVTGSMPNSIIWEIRLRMYGNHLCVVDLRWTKMQGNIHLLAYDNLRRDPKLKEVENSL
ncbi:hypothetical protein C1H46_003948 [Malus baccata]|uniref:Plant intracellular Ras-group-related LRR protein 6 n=1 Tax=Malus baccata TaxID=106549 RepID=A0A540NIR0_MALBA|nr:hypothetical protein C1H46_003948 [Malus baccata]